MKLNKATFFLTLNIEFSLKIYENKNEQMYKEVMVEGDINEEQCR